jgi:hypothetical protein
VRSYSECRRTTPGSLCVWRAAFGRAVMHLGTLRPGSAGEVQRRPSPVGVEMLDVGNGGFSHFHQTAGSHFQGTCWKWQKSRSAAIFRCPTLFPSRWALRTFQAVPEEAAYQCARGGQPAAAEALLSRSISWCAPTGLSARSKPGLGSIKKHARDAMAFRE